MWTLIRNGSLLLLALTACTPTPRRIEVSDEARRLELNALDDRADLHVTVFDEKGLAIPNPKVHFVSSHPGIVEISNAGHIVPHDDGSATITIRCGYAQASASVKVAIYGAIRVPDRRVELDAGETEQLMADVLLRSGRKIEAPIAWRSSDPRIAEVDERGLLVARAPGKATITVSAKKLSVAIEVIVGEAAVPPDAT